MSLGHNTEQAELPDAEQTELSGARQRELSALLLAAIRRGDVAGAKEVLNTPGYDVDTPTRDREVPFIEAVRLAGTLHPRPVIDPNIIPILIAHKPNPAAKDSNRDTALLVAVRSGNMVILEDVARYCQEKDVSVFQSESGDGETAVLVAVRHGRHEAVNILGEYGADVNYCNSKGEMPLIEAVEAEKPEMVSCLLQCGADPNLQNHRIETALTVAERNDQQGILRILRDHKPKTRLEVCEGGPSQVKGYDKS